MTDQDKIIASLRKQLQEALKKNSALEQELALLQHQIQKQKSQKHNTFWIANGLNEITL